MVEYLPCNLSGGMKPFLDLIFLISSFMPWNHLPLSMQYDRRATFRIEMLSSSDLWPWNQVLKTGMERNYWRRWHC